MRRFWPATRPHAGLVRELITPEGVDLRLRLAGAGERAGAFLIDAACILAILLAISSLCLAAANATRGASRAAIGALWLVGFFTLRNGWFLGFELGPRAATPGKRMLGLRVAARDGGRLAADALIARNAMREIEVFLPLTFLLMNLVGVDRWTLGCGLVWSGVFALFPLFNRDRLRVGDLVAGTWVVVRPPGALFEDLAARTASGDRAFAPSELDAYGIKELQVLESVLRRNNQAAIATVAQRIRAKLGRQPARQESDAEFLDAYYVALRERLEGRLRVGRRRLDKHEAA